MIRYYRTTLPKDYCRAYDELGFNSHPLAYDVCMFDLILDVITSFERQGRDKHVLGSWSTRGYSMKPFGVTLE